MIYILTRAAWPRKEIKNQCLHTLAGIGIGLIAYMLFGILTHNTDFIYVSVACFASGMEIDQYAKVPSKIKLIDCIRDFCFYMLGAVVAGVIV